MLYTNIWYVAETSEDLGGRPLRVRMLGRDFVLFRTGDGQAACLSDACKRDGDCRVIPSPGRRQDPGGRVFDTVPMHAVQASSVQQVEN